MYKVAFIDDGIMDDIQEEPKQVKKYKVINGEIQEREKNCSEFCLSHGTMCFWVFSEYISDKEFILYDIQILNELTSSGKMEDLLKALQFCFDEKVNLINMSLGNIHYINNVCDKVLEKLYNSGTIMVAAQNNSNQLTYPACSQYVYGVTRDYVGVLKKNQFCYIGGKSDKIDIISHCEFYDIETNHGILMGKQNSFSAPYISALIYNEMKKGKKRKSILHFLKNNSSYYNTIDQWEYRIRSMPDWHEEITAPVIAIETVEMNAKKTFMGLINEFRKENFHTVGIWFGSQQLENQVYVFQYPVGMKNTKSDIDTIVKWVSNITEADIIFLAHEDTIPSFHSEIVDLMLKDGEEKNNDKALYIAGKNIKQMTEMIVEYFE